MVLFSIGVIPQEQLLLKRVLMKKMWIWNWMRGSVKIVCNGVFHQNTISCKLVPKFDLVNSLHQVI